MLERMAMAWDMDDKPHQISKTMKKRRRQSENRFNVSPKEIQRIEELLGVKFLDFYKGIFKIHGIVWKPVKSRIEYICASWDDVPMMKLSVERATCYFVPLEWEP